MERHIVKNGISTGAGLMVVLSLLVMMLTMPAVSWADRHGGPPPGGPHGDRAFGPDHHYPPRGAYFDQVPPNHHIYHHHGKRFYSFDGIWYEPFGPRFMVVAPPFGLIVPVLPPFYATIWIGGSPYYYANDVYYKSVPEGYMIVEQPKEKASQSAVIAEKVFIYPRKNQSEQQQAKDRYECHRWAVSQTN